MQNGQIGATVALNHDMPGLLPVATGDFNNDGSTDLVWRNANGDTGVWFMQNGAIGGTVDAGNTADATAIASGEFDYNNHGDILWQSAGGLVSTWLMI